MYDEDELLWANNGEVFSHDPGPRDIPVRLLPVRNRAVEPQFNPPGRIVRIWAMPEHFADPPRVMREVARREEVAIEAYDATELEARREEEHANIPSKAEGRPPGEPAMVDPVMEGGTTDVDRPVRVRRPPLMFGIDEFVS